MEAETLPQLRRTGIEVVGDAPWGTHFCQFYASRTDLTETLVPYFAAGLAAGEFCMWVTSPPLGAAEAWEALGKAVPDLAEHRRRGNIEIVPYTDWYLAGGGFDPDRVLQGWVTKLEAALARGCTGLRLTGNTFWLERSDWRGFAEYEAAVDAVLGQYRMLALCTYSLDRCGASEIADVIRNHQFALIKREGRWELFESFDRRRLEETARRTERANAELERRVAERTAALAAANAELEAFAYSVSHDLRTPLRGIEGFARILLEDHPTSLDAEAARLLGGIRDGTRRMTQLIDDILAFSRLGRAGMSASAIDMNALARAVWEELRPAAGGRDVALELGELPPARGDRAMVRQVLENLLGNAIKFTGPRARAVVAVAGRVDGGLAVYTVRDNGVGFDMAYAPKLFGVFQRLHGEREFEGTGIGLAIVKRIVTRHGGEVTAEARPGEGAVVRFSLPRAGGEARAEPGA